ncbi:hypothetical protein HYX14_00915 [Candidatus Woesearchaeota archaeon]|nr:hypothetical protein [Candidatus Woesearchaeota archaeon]
MNRRTFLEDLGYLVAGTLGSLCLGSSSELDNQIKWHFHLAEERNMFHTENSWLRTIEQRIAKELPPWQNLDRHWIRFIRPKPKLLPPWDRSLAKSGEQQDLGELQDIHNIQQVRGGYYHHRTRQVYVGEPKPYAHVCALLEGTSPILSTLIHESAHYFFHQGSPYRTLEEQLHHLNAEIGRDDDNFYVLVRGKNFEAPKDTYVYQPFTENIFIQASRGTEHQIDAFFTNIKKAYHCKSGGEVYWLLRNYAEQSAEQGPVIILNEINAYFCQALIYDKNYAAQLNPKARLKKHLTSQLYSELPERPFNNGFAALVEFYSVLLEGTKQKNMMDTIRDGCITVGKCAYSYSEITWDYPDLWKEIDLLADKFKIHNPHAASTMAAEDHTLPYREKIRDMTRKFLKDKI